MAAGLFPACVQHASALLQQLTCTCQAGRCHEDSCRNSASKRFRSYKHERFS